MQLAEYYDAVLRRYPRPTMLGTSKVEKSEKPNSEETRRQMQVSKCFLNQYDFLAFPLNSLYVRTCESIDLPDWQIINEAG